MAQDGGDMQYVKPVDLKTSDVGKKVHLDFFNRSFWMEFDAGKRSLDKVTLKIEGKDVEFLEHRVDDGFNNWFKKQYLVSTDGKVTINYFKLMQIDKRTLTVTAYLKTAPYEQQLVVSKSDLAEILIKVD